MGLVVLLGCRAKAASWKAPTILPRTIQPRLPPWFALSSLNFSATLLNAIPSLSIAMASAILPN